MIGTDAAPVICRLRLEALDTRVLRTVPEAQLFPDEKRRMLCIRFRASRDVYDLTEFELSPDGEFVRFDRDEYTRLLFWLREEYARLCSPPI